MDLYQNAQRTSLEDKCKLKQKEVPAGMESVCRAGADSSTKSSLMFIIPINMQRLKILSCQGFCVDHTAAAPPASAHAVCTGCVPSSHCGLSLSPAAKLINILYNQPVGQKLHTP
ncbi:hypothetical protein ATANTOWER_029033 [Ataeniobius toweri]|uniref:Uncharacterized protein n=1 Tax=Ataeniobius toweri TaxID=208326 RepID=A0ABU7BKP1_9TELE|nr:hypothetical protein [Ataeniobius toweri]